MPGNTQLGLRQAFSMSRLLQAMRYMLAVGPPRSEMTPVKPGTRVAHLLDFLEHAGFAAALDDAALVLGDAAEGAAAETAALDGDRELDHLVGRDLGLAVSWDAARARYGSSYT